MLTDTARVHETAWRRIFDAAGFGPFTHDDYVLHVDGRPREDGNRAFLTARGKAEPDDTRVARLAEGKTRAFLAEVDTRGVRASGRDRQASPPLRAP